MTRSRPWQIILMTLLGRTGSDVHAELLFSDSEIEVLHAYARKCIDKPIPLGEAVGLIARLGG